MPDHDLEKLLGGFAADTLTAEEKQQLYQAALHDQELFTALADEQALRELLADPVVRRRLLQSLRATSSATAGGSSSWLDWFRRPAGLAWAGGLAAAVFAVVLGTKIYQESVKETGRSVATEEVRPVVPPAAVPSASQPATQPVSEPKSRVSENVAATAGSPQKEARASKAAKRETTAPTKPEGHRTRDSVGDRIAQRSEQDALRKQEKPPINKLAQPNVETPISVDQRRTPSSPSPPASIPTPVQALPNAATAGQAASPLSARSLFYGEALRSVDTLEQEHAESPVAESSKPSPPIEPKKQRFTAGNTMQPGLFVQPLGIRYGLETDRTADQNHEREAKFADESRLVTLTIESNQDGYLQVWAQAKTSPPQLIFPSDQTKQIASKLAAHTRIHLPIRTIFDTLVIRFSHISADGADPSILDRSAHNQLRESVGSQEEDGSQAQATYVVNRDPTLPEIVVRIPIAQP